MHDPPFRYELLNLEQLRDHARELARWQKVDPRGGRNTLLERLDENKCELREVYDLVARAAAEGRHIAPAAEWLIDNFYLIEQQIRIARLHLPRAYGRQLPRLTNKGSEGIPRVYDMALELISHVDGHVDAESAASFVGAYESVAPLKLGELWAFPIMLRLGLIENLRRIAGLIALQRRHRDLALSWAERIIRTAENEPRKLIQILADLDRTQPPMSAAFVQEFYSKLQGRGPALEIVLGWIEHELSDQGLTTDQIIKTDSHEQAASQVSVANNIGSLRFLGAMDWREFVESLSLTEQALRRDPIGAYARQEFETRDRCRHAVEDIAVHSPASEEDVAGAAVLLAAEAQLAAPDILQRAHVGYYLIDGGRRILEKKVGMRRSLKRLVSRPGRRVPLVFYLGPVGVVSGLAAGGLAALAKHSGLDGPLLWVLVVAALVAASSAGVSLTNLFALRMVRPKMLPRMDFSHGIPAEHRAMVVVPSILTDPSEVASLLEDIEIRYLGNRDPNLTFGLLTDFPDAAQQEMPGDEELVGLGRAGIRELNEKYAATDGRPDAFYFFHRRRVWNPHERLWMGYERKRGKLEQFNALLRGGPLEPFQEIVGDLSILPNIKYVISLDRDTHLPRESGAKLVGTMAHPLNRPIYDPAKGRVVQGHAVLQPRLAVKMTSANRSIYSRLTAGDAGIDPYTREVSDVYQDLFGEGSYCGKGIYDVDAFMSATGGRFPENLILSHDLIEGCFARSALVTDIELVENLPSSYVADAGRRHRWTRGDWQIMGWILPWPRNASGRRTRNPLTPLSRWKIFDNLRRSLAPPALLTVFAGGLLVAPRLSLWWTLFLLSVLIVGPLVSTLLDCLALPRDRNRRAHWRSVFERSSRRLAQTALALAFLPYDSLVLLSALVGSSFRLAFFRFSRRKMFLWYSRSSARRNAKRRPHEFLIEMGVGPLTGVALAAVLYSAHPGNLWAAAPVLAAWLAGPIIGWWISRPLSWGVLPLTDSQRLFLGGLARRIWAYFEEFVGAGDNWLPPDNFQESPGPLVASRTSPTNLGMNLQANLAASDLGYLSCGRFLGRTDSSLTAMEMLERFRGHFFNWYDTVSLRPLRPRYISTVDSGNLLGSLMILRAGLAELKTRPILPAAVFSGLRDGVEAAASAMAFPAAVVARLLEDLRGTLAHPDGSLASALELLERVQSKAGALAAATVFDEDSAALQLAEALERQARDWREDLLLLVPDPGSFKENPCLLEIARKPGASPEAAGRLRLIEELDGRAAAMENMNFDFLYDRGRDLLAIGYRVDDHRRDPSFYDLLASEARFSSFVLIARGLLPQKHWFALSRLLTRVDGGLALLSWSGSMFEYLMPLIWMPMVDHTLLDQTYRAVVDRHVAYGRECGIPWGISESCYNAADSSQTYQYAAFGVPGLGFKRDLGEDLVVAPYASILALMVSPGDAFKNLRRMADNGFLGRYGFYEAIDYTASRLPRGKPFAVVKSFMTHHQGMSLLSLENVLLGGIMQQRFMSDPTSKATERLLHERVPTVGPTLQPRESEDRAPARTALESGTESRMQVFTDPNTPVPEVHLLSNGSYHVMTTAAGGGYSRWHDMAVTRWREDSACDNWGTFIYLREPGGPSWSAAYQPTVRSPASYEAVFASARTEYRRRDAGLETYTEITVSPEDDVEIRRLRISNLSDKPRRVEVTSYAEVVLDALNADLAHRVFSNLFVETEIVRDRQALLCHRRIRRPDAEPAWMLHFLAAVEGGSGEPSYETDREKFIGRGRSVADPIVLDPVVGDPRESPLSDSEGAVLDPIVAVRRVFSLPPDGTAVAHIVSGMASTRQGALALVDKYRDPRFIERAFEMAWSHNQVLLRNLGASESDARAYERLAGSILFSGRLHRASPNTIASNRLGQAGLWRFGISGDLPIMLVRIRHAHALGLVRSALKAHTFWRSKGLDSDLVVLNDDFSGYRQALQEEILRLIHGGPEAHSLHKAGGVFVRRGEELSEEERALFQSVARVVLTDADESLSARAERSSRGERLPPAFTPMRREAVEGPMPLLPRERVLGNGLGGFTPDGREYVISLEPGQTTRAPWSNVIASPKIGTVISESGGAYTWVENAHEFRLTTWHNDPLSDPSGEAFYIRDEETGRFWSPTPLPAPGVNGYVCRHGFGYSVFEHYEAAIYSELWIYVAVDEPVKFAVMRLRNHSGRKRRISLTGFWELTMGQWRHLNQMHIVTSFDPEAEAVLARNPYAQGFSERTVFAAASEPNASLTGNRTEFIGRNGSLRSPAAMRRSGLSGKTGAGLDPCAALSVVIELSEGEEREVVFLLGASRGEEEAQRLVKTYGGAAAARQSLQAVWDRWNRLLGAVYVESPDQAFNVLVNGWLAYQVISSRFWGRSGYYQSSGAYGFRDQLQDSMALLDGAPWLAREQILLSAEHQFREGDVQHWWHPPSGRGVRTHISDDSLWLPYAVCRYVKATGDSGLLDEQRPFLEGRPVDPGEDARFDLWQRSSEMGSVYEHCVRAIKRGLTFGVHGLPLIGSGDWNDGMNLVGRGGRGESVWLAWFLFDVLSRFAELADAKGDGEFGVVCRRQAETVRQSAETNAWDGRWYRRAYFDDGRALGSAANAECQIDSLPQSWAVISGAAAQPRARRAMESVVERLYLPQDGLVRLLDPPFDSSALEPGYIKAYPPGVRENGGHYSHAAIWVTLAFAMLGDKKRAWELFGALNPIRHADTPGKMEVFRVEPYVMPGDILAASPHRGRGGWTWYTGSAGWMYRLAVETLLGLRLEVDKLWLEPLLPDEWESCRVHYRFRETFYHVTFRRVGGPGDSIVRVSADGRDSGGPFIPLADDRADHQVEVLLGA
ncbi:MAG: cyclic beta 1-2 glucan synthetase [Candidatus Aminicenantes bacterium RBG_16_66_30]|nr:MAG: cyclic beta 1-2 glucan synthetase [Candidatus Aminicenantes bacterium RBG_16_66_30]